MCRLHFPCSDLDGGEIVAATVVCWVDTQFDVQAAEGAVKSGDHPHNVVPVVHCDTDIQKKAAETVLYIAAAVDKDLEKVGEKQEGAVGTPNHPDTLLAEESEV